jgi:hypothetical protein
MVWVLVGDAKGSGEGSEEGAWRKDSGERKVEKGEGSGGREGKWRRKRREGSTNRGMLGREILELMEYHWGEEVCNGCNYGEKKHVGAFLFYRIRRSLRRAVGGTVTFAAWCGGNGGEGNDGG